ncbi:MAG: UbiH/UbiF family hydroxylase [Pseudomonadota bacterium]
MNLDFDVIVVGGGLAGLSLACALDDTPLRIALLEQNVFVKREPLAQEWDNRVYAISPANADFLKKLNVWKNLDAQRITPIRAMQVFADGGSAIEFSAYANGLEQLAWIIESSLMEKELWEHIKRQNRLTLLCPAQASALDIRSEAAFLRLVDGRSLSARLIVGAEGRQSWLRTTAGLCALDYPYGEKGVVANFECAYPHRDIARQWFREDGVLACLPLPGQRISIVWSTPEAHAQTLLSLSADHFAARVAAAAQHELGALRMITSAAAFPLSLLRVPQVVMPRLALIGDAAHGVHPLSGHGINLGYQDAQQLAQLLAATPSWQDIGDLSLLRRYQRARREETVLMQNMTHFLQRIFASRSSPIRRLRNLGVHVANRLPLAKNLLVRYALGSF